MSPLTARRPWPAQQRPRACGKPLPASVPQGSAASRSCSFSARTRSRTASAPCSSRSCEDGWLTHLATNGAGIIHDWEFATSGRPARTCARTSRAANSASGRRRDTTSTSRINVGAYEGRGYGESVGALIENEGADDSVANRSSRTSAETSSTATRSRPRPPRTCSPSSGASTLQPGPLPVPHRWKHYSAQAAAFRLGVPFTGHPMIGHDIIYTHPMNHGGVHRAGGAARFPDLRRNASATSTAASTSRSARR